MNRPRTSQAPASPRRYNRPTFTAAKLLLVEGPDEFHFFRVVQPREDVQIHVDYQFRSKHNSAQSG